MRPEIGMAAMEIQWYIRRMEAQNERIMKTYIHQLRTTWKHFQGTPKIDGLQMIRTLDIVLQNTSVSYGLFQTDSVKTSCAV